MNATFETELSELSESTVKELRRHNLLQTLVQRRVVADAVAEQTLDPEACQQAREQFCRQNGLQDDAAVQTFLTANGLSADDLTWQIELPLRIRAHCDEHYRHKAEARFLARKNQLDRVVYSLLRVKDGFLARELYLRLDAGEANFADLAAEFSEGAEKQTNGIVGPVPLTQAHPALAERLRTSPAGQLMQPFQIAEWWLVARLESYNPASFDAPMAQQMAGELFDQWVREESSLRLRVLAASGVVTAQA
jgi:parvulin-like peptidyl-prolyl isomerase